MNIVIVEGQRPSLLPQGPDLEQRLLGQQAEIYHFGAFPLSTAKEHLPKAHAVISRPGTMFGADYIGLLEQCRVIVSLGVGVDHIDVVAAKAKGIPVANVPDYGTEEVADSAVAMVFSQHRRLGSYAQAVRHGEVSWDWRLHQTLHRTSEQKVGIIGLGRIGTAVGLRLKALGFQVYFYDPYLPSGTEKAVGLMRYRDLNAMIQAMSIISVHTPLTPETEGMINKDFLETMPANGLLVNVSRGKLFQDMDVVYRVLRDRSYFRVATDVWT